MLLKDRNGLISLTSVSQNVGRTSGMSALTASNGGVFVARVRQFGSRGCVDNLYVEAEYQASYATFGRFSIAAATS